MEKTIYAESTLMYRPIQNDELSQFKKNHHIRRRKKRRKDVYDYKKNSNWSRKMFKQ